MIADTRKINNYYILSIRPAKTVRWIIIWSLTDVRLPDTLTRPAEQLDIPTSFTRLLPAPNTARHVVRPYRPLTEVRSAITAFLDRINLLPADMGVAENEIRLEARSNTWSRAARRKLAKAATGSAADEAGTNQAVLLRATLRIQDGSVEMDWNYGRDRADFDRLWKSVLANSGLVNRGASGEGAGKKRKADDGERETDRKNVKAHSTHADPVSNP